MKLRKPDHAATVDWLRSSYFTSLLVAIGLDHGYLTIEVSHSAGRNHSRAQAAKFCIARRGAIKQLAAPGAGRRYAGGGSYSQACPRTER